MSPRPTQTLSDDSGIKHRVASGSARTLTSPPDSASPRFLSDTRLCPTMTSKSLCRSTVGQNVIVGSGSIQTLTSSPGSASPRFLSDTSQSLVCRTTAPGRGSGPLRVSPVHSGRHAQTSGFVQRSP